MVFVNGKHDKKLSEKLELKEVPTFKGKRAILIDPEKGTITEVDHTGNYKEIYTFIEADMFEMQRLGTKGKQENDIYVDEEGLLKPIKFGFQYGNNQPLVGKGLILGNNPNNGESKSTNLTLEEVKANVRLLPNIMVFKMAAIAWSKQYE